jgi:hypothetical protein
MNCPARFESLLWMASPMVAWSQASAPATHLQHLEPQKRAVEAPPAAKTRRKRGKTTA